jgi:glycerol-3-phosphate cytidylyltransferase
VNVYTGGTFDILHIGHVVFLERCSLYGDVTVSLNTDEFIQSYKGKKPIYSYEERKKMLELLPTVHKVIPNTGGKDSKPSILEVNPDVIIIGSDWATRDYYSQMDFTQEWLDEYGIGLMYIPYTKIISSSDIKRRIIDATSSNRNIL